MRSSAAVLARITDRPLEMQAEQMKKQNGMYHDEKVFIQETGIYDIGSIPGADGLFRLKGCK